METQVDEKFMKRKKIVIYSIIATSVLFVIVLLLMIYLSVLESKKTKFVINGETTYKVSLATVEGTDTTKGVITIENQNYDLFCVKDNKYFYNINTLSDILKYEYKKGEYNPVSEDSNKCYVDNGGEYSSFSYDSNIVRKQAYKASNSSSSSTEKEIEYDSMEIYKVDDDIIKVDNNLYAPSDAISIGFNVSISIENNNIQLYDLTYLNEYYTKYATNKGYDGISTDFKNKRALVNGFIVVQENNKYGVYSIEKNSEVISTKYDSLEYVENMNQFICLYTGKYGILSPESEESVINIEYDTLSLLNANEMLYLVSKSEKYGVISGNGKVIVPIKYESIGLGDLKDYKNQTIVDKYILFDNIIVVYADEKYSLYSVDGKLLKENYDGLGCTNADKVVQGNDKFMNTLIIDTENDIKGLVFQYQNKYGIVDKNGDVLVPANYDSIFYIEKESTGKEFYIVSLENNSVTKLEDYLMITGAITDQDNNDSDNMQNSQNNQEQSNNENNS